eukprot:1550789-Pleurochrysis_carterae.AAC.3
MGKDELRRILDRSRGDAGKAVIQIACKKQSRCARELWSKGPSCLSEQRKEELASFIQKCTLRPGAALYTERAFRQEWVAGHRTVVGADGERIDWKEHGGGACFLGQIGCQRAPHEGVEVAVTQSTSTDKFSSNILARNLSNGPTTLRKPKDRI